MKTIILSLCLTLSICAAAAQTDTTFVKGVDLYYGHFSGKTPYKYFNHQLWLLTDNLNFDGKEIEGTDGRVMRLDLFNNSETDITGSYEIVGPNYADKPGCMNKKFTYYTYFEDGAFLDYKLTVGTCTITCSTSSTYDITYDVQEIDNGPKHKGTLHNIPITAIYYKDNKPYTLTNTCSGTDIVPTCATPQRVRKYLQDGQIMIEYNGKKSWISFLLF